MECAACGMYWHAVHGRTYECICVESASCVGCTHTIVTHYTPQELDTQLDTITRKVQHANKAYLQHVPKDLPPPPTPQRLVTALPLVWPDIPEDLVKQRLDKAVGNGAAAAGGGGASGRAAAAAGGQVCGCLLLLLHWIFGKANSICTCYIFIASFSCTHSRCMLYTCSPLPMVQLPPTAPTPQTTTTTT